MHSLSQDNVSLNGSGKLLLSSQNLFFFTTPVATAVNKIVYTLRKLPDFGSLLFKDNRILPNDNFTQADVNNGMIKYKMHRTAYNFIKDRIIVEVSADLCQNNVMFELMFLYKPPENLLHKYNCTLNTVKVLIINLYFYLLFLIHNKLT